FHYERRNYNPEEYKKNYSSLRKYVEESLDKYKIGIPGFSSQELEEFNQQEVLLGHMPMDPAMRDEVEKVLSDEDNYRIAQIEAEYQSGTDEQKGTIIASGSADNTVRLWDVKKGISDDSYDVDNLSTNKVRSQDSEAKPYSYMKSSAPAVIPT
ncbi:593_t:CDS:2, partial [Racocetra fulgida]